MAVWIKINKGLDEVREYGRMVGGEEWQEKAYDREEWKRFLRMARNHHILYMPMDWLIVLVNLHIKHTKVSYRGGGLTILQRKVLVNIRMIF